ncbi:hypothetical protein [Synechococcus phage Ssp-JY38]|nr:hypothetical protein [Synechococcus phage Yong-L2-223]
MTTTTNRRVLTNAIAAQEVRLAKAIAANQTYVIVAARRQLCQLNAALNNA